MQLSLLAVLLASLSAHLTDAIAHFQVVTVSDTSMVIRMIDALNVSRFDMRVQIFDVDHLSEFRRTELAGSTKDQLFAFDGLTPHTWFAFRIRYRLVFQGANEFSDLETKQELVIRTHNNTREDPAIIDDQVAFIDEVFLEKKNVYISVSSVFRNNKQVHTVILPELRCQGGLLKTLAQQVVQHARFHFDLSFGEHENHIQDKERTRRCTRLCIFPYIRVDMKNTTSETFRAKEWCGTLEDAKRESTNFDKRTSSSIIFMLILTVTAALFSFFL